MEVTIENGNKEIVVSITGSREWEGGDHSRIYYDLAQTGKRSPVASFYEILAGESRHMIEAGGKKFGFEFGVDANSNSKKAAVRDGLMQLAKQLAA